MLLQIITDPGTLEGITRYLPTFSIVALGSFALYMVSFVMRLLKKEQENREASTKAIEAMSDSVKGLSDNISTNFKDVHRIIQTEADMIKSHIKDLRA